MTPMDPDREEISVSQGEEGASRVGSAGLTPPFHSFFEGEYLTPGEKFGDYQVLQSIGVDLLGGLPHAEYYRVQRDLYRRLSSIDVQIQGFC